MRALTRLLFLVLVVIAVGTLWWLDTVREREPEPAVAERAAHEPSHYFEGFRLRAYQRPGKASHVLEGERLVRYADDGSAMVTQPDLHYLEAEAPPWRITGRVGHISPDGDRVEIEDDVVLERQARSAASTIVETSRLEILTTAGRARTDQAIVARRPGWRVSAVGMTAFFEAGRIELHADVRGHYDPITADEG